MTLIEEIRNGRKDLRRADLSWADLRRDNLRRADLRRADLRRANLRRADLSWADLRRANLRRANLSWANLSEADLSEADLSWANLSEADLSEANLSWANLSWANLSEADLSEANLSWANLSWTNLSWTKGLFDAAQWLRNNHESDDKGIIAYKAFGSNYASPEYWQIKPGAIIREVVNLTPTVECACGVNVATLQWVKNNCKSSMIWKVRVPYHALINSVVPYNTDGKWRTCEAELLEIMK